jgi:hypothetical protein
MPRRTYQISYKGPRTSTESFKRADSVQYELPRIYRPVPFTRPDRCEGGLGSMSV